MNLQCTVRDSDTSEVLMCYGGLPGWSKAVFSTAFGLAKAIKHVTRRRWHFEAEWATDTVNDIPVIRRDVSRGI